MIASGVAMQWYIKLCLQKGHGQFVEVTFACTHYILIEVNFDGNLHLHICETEWNLIK